MSTEELREIAMSATAMELSANDLTDGAPPMTWRAAGALWFGLALLGWVPLAALGAVLL